MPNNWSNGYPDIGDGTPASKKRYVPSPEKIRKMAMASREGGRFICTKCNTGFSLTYGVFGKMKEFEDPSFYCRDCAASDPNFRKVR